MERSQQYVGIDGEGLQRLALVLSQAADQLGATRTALVNTFAAVDRVSSVPAQVSAIEGWLSDRIADVRRRATDVGVQLDHLVSPPAFHRDPLSGFHLQGFIGLGLGYRHLGQETRTVTDVWDCGDDVTSTVKTEQRRSVYEVWFGAGYGPLAWATTDPQPAHDRWTTKRQKVTYAREGVPVTPPTRTGPMESGACPAWPRSPGRRLPPPPPARSTASGRGRAAATRPPTGGTAR